MTSQRQIEANRRNAQKSTDPRTEAGKERSRRNALKHGLAGLGVVLPEQETEAVGTRMAEWNSLLRPFDSFEMWLLEVFAVESVRIDRCRLHEIALRDEQICREAESWDEDRRADAEELKAGLARNPSRIVPRLRSTLQGCLLLIER